MASSERQSDTDLIRDLAENGPQFQFFSAVQALHRVTANAVPVGELGPVRDEAVQFRHSTSLTFHASDIEKIIINEAEPAILTSTFLGLYGTASPLAMQFSEDVIRAEEEDQPTLRAFYEIFHHRLISLYYRAWKKYRLQAGFRTKIEDTATKRMLCMVGVDGHGARAESGLSRLEVLKLAPLLAMRARPPRVLILALRRLMPGTDIRVEPFVERKAHLEEDDRMRLGRQNNRLGFDFTLGARVLDRSARFRVVLGPMDYASCEELMPGGGRYPVLRRMIEQFTRGTLECEVDVLLKENETPGYCLGSGRGGSLGVNTRLGGSIAGKTSRMRMLLTDKVEDARAVLLDSDAA